MIRADARLRVILVNYNGGALLERAVRSVVGSQWPGEIDVVIVDNASSDDSLARVEGIAGVHILRLDTNEGFGANNHGIADLLGDDIELDVALPDVVALLNPDALVRPSTFRLLAAALDEDQHVGAASPLIVFDRSFVELRIDGGTLIIDSVTAGAEECASACHGIDGAERLPGESGPVWLCPPGSTLRVPIASIGQPLVVGIAHGVARVDGVHVEGAIELPIDVAARRSYVIVQNAGTTIGDRGVGHSRGFGKRKTENLGPDANLWCGAAVVLHPDYLRSIGGFDPEYFLYYEDVELALRGLAHGWTTVHVPDAVVEHRHSDRSIQGTELVEVLQHKNRLLTLVRHAPRSDVAAGFARAALTPVSLAVSAIRSPGQRSERLRLARWRAASLGQAVRGLPHARAARKEIGGTRTVDHAEVKRQAARRGH